MKDNNFENAMNDLERSAWNSFKDVVTKFFGNQKEPDFENIVKNILYNFKNLGCSMSFKIHFLNSHLDFPENLGAFSEEQCERLHQDIKEMERRYQGRWDTNMMGNYCWMLHKQNITFHKRKSTKRSFETKKARFYEHLQLYIM